MTDAPDPVLDALAAAQTPDAPQGNATASDPTLDALAAAQAPDIASAPQTRKSPLRTRWASPPVKASPTPLKSPPPPANFTPGWWNDIGKTAATQGVLGLGDLATLPGTLINAASGARSWVGDQVTKARDLLNGMTPQQAQAAIDQAKRVAQAKMSPSERSGDTTGNILGRQFYTSQAAEKWLRGQIPALGYRPQTTAAKLVGAGVRAVPMAATELATGQFEALPATAAAMFASGAGSEGAGELAQTYLPGHPGIEGAARLAGAFAAPGALNAATGALRSATESVPSELNRTLAMDSAAPGKSVPLSKIGQIAQTGANVGVWNAGGPLTHALVRGLSPTPKVMGAIEAINDNIARQQAASNAALGSHISDTLGLGEGPFDLQQAIKSGNADEISSLYKALETDPSAQAVSSPVLDQLSQSDTISKMGNRAASVATNPGSRIIPPSPNDPGNIFYWDQIKRNLDGAISVAQRTGDTDALHELMQLKNDSQTGLLPELDRIAPAYAAARGAASDSFGAQNAVEAGYKALPGAANNFTAGNMLQNWRKYTPEQQALFSQGVGGYLKDLSEKNGAGAVVKLFSDPNKSNVLSTVLGEDAANSINGRAISESYMQNAKPYSLAINGGEPFEPQALRALLVSKLPEALGSLAGANPLPLMGLGASYALNKAAGGIGAAMAEKRSLSILKALGSSDPATLSHLAQIVKSFPQSKPIMNHILGGLRDAAVKAAIANPTSQAYSDPKATVSSAASPVDPTAEAPATGDIADAVMRTEGTARNPKSSATGPGEFTTDAFVYSVKKYHPEIAQGLNDQQIAALHGTPQGDALQADMSPKLDRDNASMLQAHGISPTPGRIKLAHFLGPSGVLRFFSAHDMNAPAEQYISPDAVAANPSVLRGKTVGEVEQWAEDLMQRAMRPGRAAGGQVGMTHEQLVNHLMTRAKQAKRATDNTTKPLLNAPDEAIVKALDVAQQAI